VPGHEPGRVLVLVLVQPQREEEWSLWKPAWSEEAWIGEAIQPQLVADSANKCPYC